MSDDGSDVVILIASEQWEIPIHVHSVTDGTGWQGRSIPNDSIGESELGVPSSATGPRSTKEGTVIGCSAPPLPPHVLLCASHRAAAAAAVAATDDDEAGFAEEGDDDDEAFPSEARITLALRAAYARHMMMQKALTETELGGADLSVCRHAIKTIIALIKHEEAEAARGCHANDKPTTPGFDDDARNGFAVGVATGLGVPHDEVRITGAHAGSVIVETNVTVDGGVEAAAAFASSLTDPANPLADGGATGVHVEEPAAAAAAAEAAPAEPAPPSAPAMADNSPLRATAIDVVFHDDDDNRDTGEQVEVRDGGLCDYASAVEDEDGGRDDFACPLRWRAVGRSQTALVGPDDDRAPARHTEPRRDVHRRRQLVRMMANFDWAMAYSVTVQATEPKCRGTEPRAAFTVRWDLGFCVIKVRVS